MTSKESMEAIVSSIAPAMKAAGYRKRRHTFNRAVGDDGFVQVMSFQMGAFNPPGTVEIPGLRPNLYGRFTVNLAVFVPAIARGGLLARDWYSDYHCQVRQRIGQLLPEKSDVWWRLDHPEAGEDVATAVGERGLPWLAQLSGYSALLDLWHSGGGSAVGLRYPAAPLDIADVLIHVGQRSEARTLLADYVNKAHKPGHSEVLRKYLIERDFGELAEQVGA